MPDDDNPKEPSDSPQNDAGGEPEDDERLIEILPDSTSQEPEKKGEAGSFSAARTRRPAPAVFTIRNTADGSMMFEVTGPQPLSGRAAQGWKIDFGTLNVQMNDLGRYLATFHQDEDETGRAAWQHTAQTIGGHMFEGLLNTDEGLARRLLAAGRWRWLRAVDLVFEGPRKYLSVPYELMQDNDTPLATRYSISRKITGVVSRHQQNLETFVHHLIQTGAPLRVLLITSGAKPIGTDQEVDTLRSLIEHSAAQVRLPVEIETLSSRKMGVEEIKRKLAHGSYHLVHYAGQVYHDKINPDQGGLLFSAGREDKLGQFLLTLRELNDLMRNGETQLFYLSACLGPQVWDEYVLQDQDYLDPLAALVEAGIPYVFGFRWFVTVENRVRFTALFYESLFKKKSFNPQQAALYARRESYRHNDQDETWASPLLVAQNFYL